MPTGSDRQLKMDRHAKEMDDSWPWAPGMEYRHADVSWIFDFGRPSTTLHKVIQQKTAELKATQEEEKLQEGTQELFLGVQKTIKMKKQQLQDLDLQAVHLQSNIVRERYHVQNKFDLWQQETSKYLIIAEHSDQYKGH